MSLIRTKVWNFGEKLTSSELNALDENVINGLDKRSGQTDVLASTVEVTGVMTHTGDLISNGQTNVNTLYTTGLVSIGGTLAVTGVSTFSGNVVTNGTLTTNGAVTVAGGLTANALTINTGLLTIGTMGEVFIAAGSTITIAPAANVPVFQSPRTYIRAIPQNFIYGDENWFKQSNGGVQNSTGGVPIYLEIPLWVGATLTNVQVSYKVGTSHLPITKFNIKLSKVYIPTNVKTDLSTAVVAPGASAATYYNDGAVQLLNVTPASTEIFANDYRYILEVNSETEALENVFVGAIVTYTVPNTDAK